MVVLKTPIEGGLFRKGKRIFKIIVCLCRKYITHGI